MCPDRPEVDVLVELDAHPEQDAAFEDSRRDVRVTDGPQIDRVEAAQLLEHVFGQRLPGPEVSLAAQVVADGLHVESVRDRAEHLEPLGHDLRAGPVPGDHANPIAARHQSSLQYAWG